MTDFAELLSKSGLSKQEAATLLECAPRTLDRWSSGAVAAKRPVLDALRRHIPTTNQPSPRFTFIDLFAGIGGLRRGFDAIGGRCVFTSEWDRFSAETYRANFPGDDHPVSGDITKIDPASIPDFDLLLAGFPCQPFSIAGVSKKNALNRPHGFADAAQGTLDAC